MSTAFRVIQFVPDPIADERINIGVVAYNIGPGQSGLLLIWSIDLNLASLLARGEDVKWLNQVPEDFLFLTQTYTESQRSLDDLLERFSVTWANQIQLTEQRGSLRDIQSLLKKCAKDYLHVSDPLIPESE